jgi:histidinol phosphatase-like PHP family hydrolase
MVKLALSGTPFSNRVGDLWPLLALLQGWARAGKRKGKTYYTPVSPIWGKRGEFEMRYCLKDAELAKEWDIDVIVGCELTHIPAAKLDSMVTRAKEAGAEIIIVHGETISEPVERGTNRAAVNNRDVNILAHPGFITMEDAQAAADNGVVLEITSRPSHSMTNGHVIRMARKVDAKMVVNSDAHSPSDLITEERALQVAMGAGLTKDEAELCVQRMPKDIIRRLRQ